MDYFSSDGNYKEPKYKQCGWCDGEGNKHNGPIITVCKHCRGSGQDEMTYEEICGEEALSKDGEADNMRD